MSRTHRNGWFGVASVAVGSFGTVLSEFLPIGLLPSISADLGVRISTAGLMVVVTGLAAAVAAPVVTVATSRLDRRVVLIGLSAVLVLADVVAAIAGVFPVLLVARVLLGVALGGFWAIGAGIAPRLVAAKDTIRATSLITAGISIATVVSLPLGALVAAFSTWRLAFVIGAALGVVALVLQLVALPTIPSQQRIRATALTSLFGVPRARVGLVVAAFLFAAQFAAYTYISPFLQDVAKLSPDVVSVALLVFGVSGIVGNFVASATLDRSVLGTLVAGGLALAAAVALLPLVAHLSLAVFALLVVWGLVWGGLPLGLQTWMAGATPEGAEAGLAMFVTTIQVALAVGSTLGGVAVSVSGLAADFGFAAVVALLGSAVLVLLGVRSTRSRLAVAHQ
ncbi:putative MFS family arabinose efflux permease [Curtobacterium flaccumfaciens]|uniref:Putative MFS family arabinose efflux permease n=1 Tax=Curtobacterium flaccumfaciens TaxID=2035 RepID=A0A4R6DDA9_9MICO|nr:MFS transporter [Curtobacterium flaccumfaciens]TDN42380.1 putative MFS family arabinose efflux permease [Curtobacterium flaccumfaciens]